MRGIFPLFGTVFLLVGAVLLLGVAFVTVNSLEKAGGIRVEGVVVEANDNQTPVVEFRTREGQRIRIEGGISASPTPYRVGERIGVFYDPTDPSAALIDSFLERWFLSLLFGGFATVFTLVGAGFTIAALRRRARRTRLIRHGQRFDGHIAGFEQNRFTKINGKRPWQVLVTWTDGQGKTRSTHSEMQREDPSRRFKIGDRVTVIADAADPANAWIDLFGESSAMAKSGSATGFPTASDSKLGKSTTSPVVRRR
jgi:hypothetical protein